MKHNKNKIIKKSKNHKSETTKYLSRLNNIDSGSDSDKNLYIINSLQKTIRFLNDYVIDADIDDDINSESILFNQKALNTIEHLYNLLYFEDSCDVIKEQIENIIEYFFPKKSNEYLLLKHKIINNCKYMHSNIGIQYFLEDL
jgi:hypothetical protein